MEQFYLHALNNISTYKWFESWITFKNIYVNHCLFMWKFIYIYLYKINEIILSLKK